MALPIEDVSQPAAAVLFQNEEVGRFHDDGYVICRQLLDADTRRTMRDVTLHDLARALGPVEFEADLHYPGAPASRSAAGGATIRRLRAAHGRHPVFTEWVSSTGVTGRMQQLLGPRVVMPLGHHNCIMTKQPRFSSLTSWHQDIRYWSYERPELISLWIALGRETESNGCLHVIPGTHRLPIARERLDADLFLRPGLPDNDRLIEQQVRVELDAGDVLFFHCRTFHAAGNNQTDEAKFSVVFTFRPWDNPPRAGSKSAAAPELLLPAS